MSTGLVPYLSYPDASAALEWMRALGGTVIAREAGPDGGVTHAEVRLGDGAVMVASDDAPDSRPALVGISTGQGIYLVVDDVDMACARAVRAGATVVIAPEDTPWGSRRARVLDPQGREWSFGTYVPGSP